MKTLKMNSLMNSLMRNLTLIAAGAFMATLVVLPITTSADHTDDNYRPVVAPVTYTLGANDGTSSVFTLVQNNGSMVLSLVEEPAIRPLNDNEDED